MTFLDGSTTLGTAPINSSTATLTTNALQGMHTITAVYNGDTSNVGSTSAPLTQSAAQGTTTTTISPSSQSVVFGQNVTMTATVSVGSNSGTPTGLVTFQDAGVSIGTGVVNSNTATFTTSTLALGLHTITAVYGGDAGFKASTASTMPTITVGQASTTLAVTWNNTGTPVCQGRPITLTATISATSASSGTPTGTVTFQSNGHFLGLATLTAAGTATLRTRTLTPGTDTITAVYGGDGNFTGSTTASPNLTLTVYTRIADMVVSSSLNQIVQGDSVSFTATLSNDAPSTNVTMTFLDNGTSLGTALLSSGQTSTTFTTSALSAFNQHITVSYASSDGTDFYISPAFSEMVDQSTLTTVTPSNLWPSPSQAITLTATVLGSTGTVTGTVTFWDSESYLGTATLNGNGYAILGNITLPLGVHSLQASYSGDTQSAPSLADFNLPVVNPGAPLTLTASSNPVNLSATVTLTATASGVTAGTVTFLDGGTLLGTGAVNPSGTATLVTSTLSNAVHTITASYVGSDDTLHQATLTETVQQTTTTTVVSSCYWPVQQSDLTFTATVAPCSPGTGVPTGTVTFYDDGSSLGTGSLASSGNATTHAALATFDDSAGLAAGSQTITAVYGNDTLSLGSTSSALSLTVYSAAGTDLALTSSPAAVAKGSSVTFTATIEAGTFAAGTVTFFDGATALGTATSTGANATLTTSALTGGVHAITAVYVEGSDVSLAQLPALNVEQATVTTSSSLSNPAIANQTITLTATMIGITSPTTGTVTFEDGGTSLGTVTIGSQGVATYTATSLAAGRHAITAIYSGDSNNNPRTTSARCDGNGIHGGTGVDGDIVSQSGSARGQRDVHGDGQ